MKKIISILLLLSFVLTLAGCNDLSNENTVNFYYCSNEDTYGSDDGLFLVEKREPSCKQDDYRAIIEEFLNGAKTKECISPFPGGTTLVDYDFNNGYAKIVLSSHMVMQSDANVIVCCACLCMTLFSFPDFHTVEVRISEKFINGEEKLIFSRNSFSIRDDTSFHIAEN